MSNRIPDNGEQDFMERKLRIKAYLEAFRENEGNPTWDSDGRRFISKKGMIKKIKEKMNPEVRGVFDC